MRNEFHGSARTHPLHTFVIRNPISHPRITRIVNRDLLFVRKEPGDYNSKECIYRGQPGTHRLPVGESITDEGKAFSIYQNSKMLLNLYPTRSKRVFVGRDEDGGYYIFQFQGKEVSVFKRKYEL